MFERMDSGRGGRTMASDTSLEVRSCSYCGDEYKVLPGSVQQHCSTRCRVLDASGPHGIKWREWNRDQDYFERRCR